MVFFLAKEEIGMLRDLGVTESLSPPGVQADFLHAGARYQSPASQGSQIKRQK